MYKSRAPVGTSFVLRRSFRFERQRASLDEDLPPVCLSFSLLNIPRPQSAGVFGLGSFYDSRVRPFCFPDVC